MEDSNSVKQITMDYETYLNEINSHYKDGYNAAINEIRENILQYDEPNKWSPNNCRLTSILHLLYLKAVVAVKKDEYDQCKTDLHEEVLNEKAS